MGERIKLAALFIPAAILVAGHGAITAMTMEMAYKATRNGNPTADTIVRDCISLKEKVAAKDRAAACVMAPGAAVGKLAATILP